MSRRILLLALLVFWALSLSGLRAVPVLHEDESWQASPAYKLSTQGVYGSDMFTGFFGMERHYYAFMPLYPLMLAGAFRLWGVGLFQARLVSLILALIVLSLTFALGRRLFGARAGAVAVLILLLARLAAINATHLTGIPLLDQARIVRYDIAVPVFGLASLVAWLKAQTDGRAWRDLLSGALAGLAGVSHLYGAFWLPALLLLTLTARRSRHAFAWLVLGFILPWLPWLAYISTDVSDFIHQSRNYADRFDLLAPGFYLNNLATEVRRYALNTGEAGGGMPLGLGTWCSVIGILAAPIALAGRAWRGDWNARAVVLPLATIEALFALLLALKTPSYAVTLWPLMAIAGGWGAVRLWARRRAWGRLLVIASALTVGLEGLWRIAGLLAAGPHTTPYEVYMAQVAEHIPPGARVLGLQNYWLGLRHTDYRALLVPFFLNDPRYTPHPLPLDQALEMQAADVVLIDVRMSAYLEEIAHPDHPDHAKWLAFWGFMERHQARLAAQVDDASYGPMRIYWLDGRD
jgi:4-amino-4-deoxy-L-arabinose transferase-like glycosyltransferase